ncbi:MAG: cytochrome b/b6 domain-containing protein [bacterium]
MNNKLSDENEDLHVENDSVKLIENNETIEPSIANMENPLVKANEEYIKNNPGLYYERFDGVSRFTHVLIIVSFLSLALTGMIIKFSGVPAFQFLSRLFGGYEITGFIHRVAAIITFIYFSLHIIYLFRKKNHLNISLKELVFGKYSMIPNKNDLIQLLQTLKWFLGLGPRPEYGRWTYWEKFDYFAVFWGVTIIGSSGLLLWFPEFFTNLGVPGSLINIATIIHSDEALLAAGFIFTIHFYNTHFRPDKFPIDTVIFTGTVDIEELKYDRPVEYSEFIQSENVRKYLKPKPQKFFIRLSKIFGFTALILGMSIIITIIYSMLFLYK